MAEKNRLILVEDDPTVNRFLTQFLNLAGFHCRSALDGVSAFQLIQELIPDLFILDFMLPDMSGLEICAKLKQDSRTAHLPIVMVTALADDQHRQQAMQAGATEYLTKPFDPEKLIETVKLTLRPRR